MGRFFQIFGGSIFGLFLLFAAVLLNQWFEFAPGGGNGDDDYRDNSSPHSENAAESLEIEGAEIIRDVFGTPKEIYLFESIGDNELMAIVDIPSLTSVTFENPRRISDRGVDYLSMLPRLRSLTLDGADITDDCIDFLIELQELRELSIEDTGISSYGYDRLNNELPNCRVSWSPRGDDEEKMMDDDYYPDK